MVSHQALICTRKETTSIKAEQTPKEIFQKMLVLKTMVVFLEKKIKHHN